MKNIYSQANVHQTNIKIYYNPLYHFGVCRDLLGTGLLKANISERLRYKAFLWALRALESKSTHGSF